MTKTTEAQLIESLRHYVAPNYLNSTTSIWHKLPIARRSAVFILLFSGNMGELRVLLTKRSSKLRNFPGHVALPGGKADNGLESEWMVSRREMHEEIGLSSSDETLSKLGISIEHICLLPNYLSRTFSCVKPCVGFMKFKSEENIEHTISSKLNLALNPGESSSIFSCPLKDFLYPTVDEQSLEALERVSYKVSWGGIPWDLRSYTFLQNNVNDVHWLRSINDLSASEEEDDLGHELDQEDKGKVTPPNIPPMRSRSKSPTRKKQNLQSWGRLGSRKDDETNEKIYDVWGLTANILHDLSEIVYLNNHKINRHIGEEELIYSLFEFGKLMQKKERSDDEVKLIHSSNISDDTKEFGFKDILPSDEFSRLHSLYKL
ncbi:PCD1 [Candida pseudojiufengensis]|uniref:PCD1 n=1 Tax=Candida pseudojiufengensis TaxID=497109 RepID=UPI0022242D76|nr:PCD1 [Candida pseudojiufengensis]KAI5959281.1 PCD1 [Candida pseudojiufengensis]